MDTVSDYRKLQTLIDSVLLYMLSIISNHLCAYKVTCAIWSSKAAHLSHTPVIHPFSFPSILVCFLLLQNTTTKPNLDREGILCPCPHYCPYSGKSRQELKAAEIWRQKQKQRQWRNAVYWFAFHDLIILPSYTT